MTRQGKSTGQLAGWLETGLITLSGPLLGTWLRPADPYLLHAAMPWFWLLPLLCGAQHGLGAGLASSALLSLLIYGHVLGVAQPYAALFHFCVGAFVVGGVSGQLRDLRSRQKQKLAGEVATLSERLERAERSGRVLTISHSRLEERLAAMRWSLGSAVSGAEKRMQQLTSRRELGETLLEVLASQAMVQAASLYWVSAGRLLPAAVATLGAAPSSSQLHPLVQRAFGTRRLTTVVDPVVGGSEGTVLAAVPVLTSAGHGVGVIAIHHMAFMAFQHEQLSALSNIVGQLGDMMNDRLEALHGVQEVQTAAEWIVEPPARISIVPAAAAASSSLHSAPVVTPALIGGPTSANLVVPAPLGRVQARQIVPAPLGRVQTRQVLVPRVQELDRARPALAHAVFESPR